MRDLRAPRRPQRVEEPLQGGRVTSRRGPHQPTAVMVDDDQQVQVPTFVGDLVNADPAQPLEPIRDGFHVGPHPRDDRAHGAPGDAHQLRQRGLGGWVANQATCSIEDVGVPGVVASPRHRRDHHPMLGQLTRGASASTNVITVPASNDRHRRRPAPWSYPRERRTVRTGPEPAPSGAPRPRQRPALRRTRRSSTTALSTPTTARHKVATRTPFS